MNESRTVDWQHYQKQAREVILFLPHFFKNPVTAMKNLPQWDWPRILILHAMFGLASGLLNGLLRASMLTIVIQPFVSLISTLMIGFAGAALFYYFILFYLNRQTDFLRMYIMVAIATLPLITVRSFAHVVPPINLVGFGMTCLLCVVGLVENFAVERKLALRLIGGIFVLFFAFWTVETIRSSRDSVSLKNQVSPESLDILEKEMAQ